jgi:uncharacterized protein YukE
MARRKQKDIYLMPEPKWQTIHTLKTDEERTKLVRNFEYFVHYEVADKKCASTIFTWLEKDSGLDPELIKKLRKVPDVWFSSFAKHTYIWHKTNGYMADDVKEHLLSKIPALEDKAENIIEEKEEKAKDAKPKVSIQQRMREQVEGLLGNWEGYVDDLTTGDFNLKKFDPFTEMKVYGGGVVKPNHAKIIKDDFTYQYAEALEVQEWKDEDIKEAYGFMDKKMRKDFVAIYEKINAACDAFILTGKANRKTRKPKAVSKEKVVGKLKFQINDSTLGIASVNPTEVVDATEIWVYNTKTRKVGMYVVDDLKSGMTVKGTTLQDFHPTKSVQKTLRKPAEQIKNWTGNAKTKFSKAFKDLTTTDTKMNGRFNDTTIILKAF